MKKPYQAHQVLRISREIEKTNEYRKNVHELREQINQDVERYLANGGEITILVSYTPAEPVMTAQDNLGLVA